MYKILLLAVAVLLAACAPKQDIDFFKKNEAERIAKVAECSGALLATGKVGEFETDTACVAAFLAEPYQPREFWNENKALKSERLKTCKAVGIELKGSSTCQSVFKSLFNMGGGTIVRPSFRPSDYK